MEVFFICQINLLQKNSLCRFFGIIGAGDFMKKYDTWKIITTLITIIFIAVMVILNVINLSEEKNAKTETQIGTEKNTLGN